jgi:hypothetical protein
MHKLCHQIMEQKCRMHIWNVLKYSNLVVNVVCGLLWYNQNIITQTPSQNRKHLSLRLYKVHDSSYNWLMNKELVKIVWISIRLHACLHKTCLVVAFIVCRYICSFLGMKLCLILCQFTILVQISRVQPRTWSMQKMKMTFWTKLQGKHTKFVIISWESAKNQKFSKGNIRKASVDVRCWSIWVTFEKRRHFKIHLKRNVLLHTVTFNVGVLLYPLSTA